MATCSARTKPALVQKRRRHGSKTLRSTGTGIRWGAVPILDSSIKLQVVRKSLAPGGSQGIGHLLQRQTGHDDDNDDRGDATLVEGVGLNHDHGTPESGPDRVGAGREACQASPLCFFCTAADTRPTSGVFPCIPPFCPHTETNDFAFPPSIRTIRSSTARATRKRLIALIIFLEGSLCSIS